MTHALLASHISNKLGLTSSVVDSKTTSITGTVTATQLEELLRIATVYNARLEVNGGTLQVKTN